MSNRIDDLDAVVFDDPDQLAEWADNNTALTPVMRRRVASLEAQWRTKLAYDQRDRLDHTVDEGIAPTHARLEKLVNDGRLETAKLIKALRAGRIGSEQALRKLAQLQHGHTEANAVIDELAASVERWESDVEQEPAAWYAEMRNRLPSMAHATRVKVTVPFLEGREPPPLRQGR